MSITRIDPFKTGLSVESDTRIQECPIFKNTFCNRPTVQHSYSLGLKQSSFELDDCSLVDSRLIHLAHLIELNSELSSFRKSQLFLLFGNYTDSNGATNKNFTILPPNIAKQFFSEDWMKHCRDSFSALLKENNNLLTSKFASSPISKVGVRGGRRLRYFENK